MRYTDLFLLRNAFPARPAMLSRILALAVLSMALPLAAQPLADPPAEPSDGPCPEGRDLYRAARFEEARGALRDCLSEEGESVEVLLPLAVMGVREGRLEEAVEYAQRAVALDPGDAEARYWYGRALLRSDRLPEARSQWEQGLAVSTEHAGILEGLARLALTDGETAKAYNLLTQLQLLGVDEAWLHGLLAEIAAGKGLWTKAFDHLEDSMARAEPSVEDLIFGAELAILSGHRSAALTYGRRAVAREPGARTRGSLGQTFFALEEVDSAIVYLQLALSEPGADPVYRFNLANALEVVGRTLEADEHFRIFLTERPDDAVGRFNFGIHLDKLGRREEALVQLARALELQPDMLSAYVVQVQILENAGLWDEALVVLGELKVRDRTNLAELMTWEARLMGQREAAREATAAGKIRLLHLVVGDEQTMALVQEELARGEDFGLVVTRFSSGPAAARGGDIGWVRPAEMVPEMRAVVADLAVNEISPPLAAGGLYHMFKRVP